MMDDAVARLRFAKERVARLATVTSSGLPHVVPVTFAIIDALPTPWPAGPAAQDQQVELIVFAVDHKPKSTTALQRLDNIAANPRVSFLVDHYDENWDQLWWVRADACAEILDGDVRARAIAALQAKYPQYQAIAPHGVVIGSTVTGLVGWQASPTNQSQRQVDTTSDSGSGA